MMKTLDIHKFISIYPKTYNVDKDHDYYIIAKNARNELAQFTLTVEKNGLNIPIEPGI